MAEACTFCGGPVNPHDLSTWKQVAGWVGGERKDSMTMREDTGKYAHDHCINKARAGQSVDQPDMFSEESRMTGKSIIRNDESLLHELFSDEQQ